MGSESEYSLEREIDGTYKVNKQGGAPQAIRAQLREKAREASKWLKQHANDLEAFALVSLVKGDDQVRVSLVGRPANAVKLVIGLAGEIGDARRAARLYEEKSPEA